MNNIYVIGDIHGQYIKLKNLIKVLPIRKNDTLIFLGDYIDRGVAVYETIEFLIDLSKKYNCIFLKGNHELMFEEATKLTDRDSYEMFLYNGGFTTKASYKKYGIDINKIETLPITHKKFFNNLKLYHETKDYIFVHGGIDITKDMKDQHEMILLWDRSFVYNSHKKYTGKTVVVGHTPGKLKITNKLICLDTGACYKSFGLGILTCLSLPKKLIYQKGKTLEELNYDRNNY